MNPKKKLPPWLKLKAPSPTLQVGIGWYTREEWQKVKAAAKDPERFEATFEEWEEMAEQSLAEFRVRGINAEKSYVIASELLAWCFAKNKSNNATSRAEFVAQQGNASTGASLKKPS